MVAELITARESGSGVSVCIADDLQFVVKQVVLVRSTVECWHYLQSLPLYCFSHLDLGLLLKQMTSLCARQTSVEC